MNIEVTGRHVKVTDALRGRVEKRVARLDGRLDAPARASVSLEVDKSAHRCEILLRAGGEEFFAKAEDRDMYAAIDGAADKISRQMTRRKSGRLSRRSDG